MNTSEHQVDHRVKRVKYLTMEMTIRDENPMQSSSQQKVKTLPPEIWNIILCKVNDAETILSCRDVCEDWNWFFKPKMPSVHHELILPLIVPYLGANDLISCSSVSHDWNQWTNTSVWNFRKNTVFWRDDDDYYITKEKLPTFLMCLDCDDPVEVERFLAEKEAVGGGHFDNTLVYRHVYIQQKFYGNGEDMNDGEIDAFCHFLVRFLRRFGRYIYHLELSTSAAGSHVQVQMKLVQMIRLLSICLSNTPNLEVFLCRFCVASHHQTFQETEEDARQVDEYLAESPLPNSNLKKLRMGMRDKEVPKKIIEVLTERYGNQLEYLHNFVQIPATTLIARGVTFENLKVLRGFFRLVDIDDQNEIRDLDYLTNLLRTLKWRLTEVDIQLRQRHKSSNFTIYHFNQALREYQPHIHKRKVVLHP